VSRPDRAARRRHGKSDPLDAYAAARTALAGDGLAVPKDEHTAALRALLSARRSAVKAHTAATNQIHALLVTAPAELRERFRRHSTIGTDTVGGAERGIDLPDKGVQLCGEGCLPET